MNLTTRLVSVPAAAFAFAGLILAPANATIDALPTEAVDALAVASCQLDPETPLTLEEMSPVVLGQADVEVVAGEITAHVFRAEVTTSAGDVQQCTFGVLHRDVQLKQVQHVGTASLALVDSVDGTTYGVETEIGLGNMGKSSPIDPTTEVSLGGFLAPESVVDDPTYTITLNRKSLEQVQVGASHAQAKAAAILLKKQLKAAAQLERKQLKAAHSDKAVAAAQKAHDRRVAAAQKAYDRALSPRTITRPVSHPYSVTGSVQIAPVD